MLQTIYSNSIFGSLWYVRLVLRTT
jgi:hypothetical protein